MNKYDDLFVKAQDSASTVTNLNSLTKYAKVMNIKTHNTCINESVGINGLITNTDLKFINIMCYNKDTLENIKGVIRCRTGDKIEDNVLLLDNRPKHFDILLSFTANKDINVMVKPKSNLKVVVQTLEGNSLYTTTYNESPLSYDISEIPNIIEPIISPVILGDYLNCYIKEDENKQNLLINAPVGGSVLPTRDSSIGFGSITKRWKEGHFCINFSLPCRSKEQIKTLDKINGSTFYCSDIKKIVTYHNGKYFSNGEEVIL